MLAGHVTTLTRDTPVPPPGEPDTFRQRFWSDGTARLTAYEYVGVTQSPCFRGGTFSCTSCHTMHAGNAAGQLAPDRLGDRACTQCHAAIARDVGAHTHHAPASSGSRCVECHMPRIVYGVLDIHRSHGSRCPMSRATSRAAGRTRAPLATPIATPRGPPTGCATSGARASAVRRAPRRRRLEIPEALASLHAGDPVQRAVTVAAIGRPDGGVPAGARGFALANTLVGLGDAYGAVRFLARRSAISLDRSLDLGIGRDSRPTTSRRGGTSGIRRCRRCCSGLPLPRATPAAAAGRPFVKPDWQLDLHRIRPLLGSQRQHVISVGE